MNAVLQPRMSLQADVDREKDDIFVDPETQRAEAFRRTPQNDWVLNAMSDGAGMDAASVGCTVALADVFFGVEPRADAAPGSAPQH
jgi:hypothetical protein